jgi:hypothetical protein
MAVTINIAHGEVPESRVSDTWNDTVDQLDVECKEGQWTKLEFESEKQLRSFRHGLRQLSDRKYRTRVGETDAILFIMPLSDEEIQQRKENAAKREAEREDMEKQNKASKAAAKK